MSDKKPGGNEGGFFKFLYNGETGEVLGRTGMSWAKIIVFYIIFYAGLAAFFGLMLYIFYCTLDIEKPKYEQNYSLIGTNPGVGFRPQPDQDANVDSTLIWFNKNNPKDFAFWSNQLKEYIDSAAKANNATGDKKPKSCGFGNGEKATKDTTCMIEIDRLGPCTAANSFGYKFGEPCILIKLNRIYGWEPLRYGDNEEAREKRKNDDRAEHAYKQKPFDKAYYYKQLEDAKDPSVPEDLIKHIKTLIDGENDAVVQGRIADSVWVFCAGENAADRENIGSMTYYPMPGIPSFYFPFKKQANYQSPFVMVHFSNVVPGVLVNIECKAYAANIHPDRQSRTGSVHFEIMVD